jgi:spore coat protein CotH
MIKSKKVSLIVAIAVVFALTASIALVVVGNLQKANGMLESGPDYATKIFGPEIISIEIIADEADWQSMLDNAIKEQYIMADVVVNGTKFQNVGVRPKGNSSLTQVARSDSDRYSFRLKFDEYIKGQTCFGLESFVVNNMLGDYSYMKEYVSYDLMREIGVDAPYFGFADIKVNGEGWGLYLAVELYRDSYKQRVYGDTTGMLYNVKSMDMGGNQPDQQGGKVPVIPDGQNSSPQSPDDESQQRTGVPQGFQNNTGDQPFLPPEGIITNVPAQTEGEMRGMDRNFAGMGGRGSSGGSLEYLDDNPESYSAIFNNVVGKGTESDFQRVVQALKALSEGRGLETYFEVDQILRYLAAHTIVVNLDSYSSGMAQNYYIYEHDGKITILPWDYNLAWGGFQSGNAVAVINFPIDTPLSGVEMSSRPLIEKLFANTEYLERYHLYLQQLIDTYFSNGKFEEKVKILDALISDYVKNDATAFCTYDEHKTAISSFITLGNLRAQSVQGQLDGTVPSTTAEQNTNADQLILAGELTLADLGSMMGGRGDNNDGFLDGMNGQVRNPFPQEMNTNMDTELMNKAISIIQQTNGEISDEARETLISLGLTSAEIDQLSVMMNRFNIGEMEQRRQNSDNQNLAGVSAQEGQSPGNNTLMLIGGLSLMLIAALLFVSRSRKSY